MKERGMQMTGGSPARPANLILRGLLILPIAIIASFAGALPVVLYLKFMSPFPEELPGFLGLWIMGGLIASPYCLAGTVVIGLPVSFGLARLHREFGINYVAAGAVTSMLIWTAIKLLIWQRSDWSWSRTDIALLLGAAICGTLSGALWWAWVRRPLVLGCPAAGDSTPTAPD
jgi:hypothetical protein